MKTELSIPLIALIAGTRVALGAGLGLLIGERLSSEQRRSAGWALTAVGALTTIPLAMHVFSQNGHRAARWVAETEELASASPTAG